MEFLLYFVLLYRIHINHEHFEDFTDQHINGIDALSVVPSNWNEVDDIIDYGSPNQVVYEIT